LEELQAVLFDMDGVLLESYEAWFRVVNEAARHFKKPDIDRQRFKAGWGQGVDADLREFFPGCTQEQIERFYIDHLLDFGEHVRADADARATLVALRDDGVLRGVVTNTHPFLARDMLAWTALIGLVDVTVGPGDGLRSKPEPDIIAHACEALGVSPARVILVGDSVFDEKAAKAAGVRFLGFRTPGKGSVQSLPDVLRFVEQLRA